MYSRVNFLFNNSSLLPVVEHIHSLWELVLTAEPLVVMAPTPTLCSATVQHLTSIIYPLSYCADYRPFYTIHDSDFKDITSSNTNALPNILLGVTNPFFSKALKHWPHIVKLGDASLMGLAAVSGGQMTRSPNHKVKAKFKLDAKPGVYSQVQYVFVTEIDYALKVIFFKLKALHFFVSFVKTQCIIFSNIGFI